MEWKDKVRGCWSLAHKLLEIIFIRCSLCDFNWQTERQSNKEQVIKIGLFFTTENRDKEETSHRPGRYYPETGWKGCFFIKVRSQTDCAKMA